MEATSSRTARKVIKKLIDARNILRWGRSGRLACRIRPSLVRWSSNSMAAVTRIMKSSSIHSPDKCMAYYSTKCEGGADGVGIGWTERKQQVPGLAPHDT